MAKIEDSEIRAIGMGKTGMAGRNGLYPGQKTGKDRRNSQEGTENGKRPVSVAEMGR